MKKKSLNLSQLNLNKDKIVSLTESQASELNGGISTILTTTILIFFTDPTCDPKCIAQYDNTQNDDQTKLGTANTDAFQIMDTSHDLNNTNQVLVIS